MHNDMDAEILALTHGAYAAVRKTTASSSLQVLIKDICGLGYTVRIDRKRKAVVVSRNASQPRTQSTCLLRGRSSDGDHYSLEQLGFQRMGEKSDDHQLLLRET
jgi:hypothetical protein